MRPLRRCCMCPDPIAAPSLLVKQQDCQLYVPVQMYILSTTAEPTLGMSVKSLFTPGPPHPSFQFVC